jgi:transposase
MHMLADTVELVIGVDTHKHTHTAAVVVAATGAMVAQVTVAAAAVGYRQLLAWADHQSGRRVWAIEGTGGYGAGLTRFLHAQAERVVELDRPKRTTRRHGAHSDPLDATRAARQALGRDQLAQPRAAGQRAALQVRLTARRSAVQAAGDAQRQLHAFVVAALTRSAAGFGLDHSRPRHRLCAAPPTGRLGHRNRHRRGQPARPGPPHPTPEAEIADHTRAITTLVRAWRPDLLTRCGVGPIVAPIVLCAWSHPGRCPSDAAFAMLAGAAPIPASSGQTIRVRLNRSGDRHLNQALHLVVLTRLRYDPATPAYAQRRRAQGKTNREIRRCLVRYVARQLYRLLEANPCSDPT